MPPIHYPCTLPHPTNKMNRRNAHWGNKIKLKDKEWKLIILVYSPTSQPQLLLNSIKKSAKNRKQHLPWFLKVCECICVYSSVCVHNSEELEKYMESKGAPPPGILTLTTSLSKPFMRLDKFPMLLKELDRHMEVSLKLSEFLSFI